MAGLAMILDNILGCVNTVFVCDTNRYLLDLETTKMIDSVVMKALKTTDEENAVVLKCQGCSKRYSDDFIPRNLSCGHTMCTSCSETWLTEEKPCLECQEKQQKSKTNTSPVNYQLLRLIRSLGNKEIDLNVGKLTLMSTDKSQLHNDKNVWLCDAHDSPKALFCYSCNVWVCENCLILDHPCPPRGSCRVMQFKDVIGKIREKYSEVATEILRKINTMKTDFELEFGMHDFCMKHCTKENGHLRVVKKMEPLLLGKKEDNAEKVKKVTESWKSLTDSFNVAQSPKDITSSCKKLLDFREESDKIIEEESNRLTSPRPYMLEHFRMEIKRLAEAGKKIYATLQEDKREAWAHVTLEEERLLLYALTEGKPPADGVTVPYKYLEMMNEDDEADKTVFLDVAADEEALSGRVFIRFTCDYNNAMIKQMILMCSGKKAVSYRNSRFFQKEEGQVSTGTYLKADGTAGGTIVPDLGDCWAGTLYRGMKSQGAILGERHSTRFHFILHHNEEECLYDHLGFVTQGFNVIKAAAKLEPVSKAYVKDCGIFLRMYRPIKEDEEEEKEEEEKTENQPSASDDW